MKERFLAAAVILAMTIAAGCGKEAEFSFSAAEDPGEDTTLSPVTEDGEEESESFKEEAEPQTIFVYICGAVVSPGVYELPVKARVIDLIKAAGGLTKEADERYINQAAPLEDGQQITVPTKDETAGRDAPENASSAETDSRIDINAADEKTLMTLPGIGEARAAAIVAYRQEHGPFKRPEDIQNISGIKGAVYEKIADRIRTGP